MSKGRTEIWITLIVLAVGLPVVGAVAFFTWVFSVKPLHSNPQSVGSVVQSTPLPRWAGAVDKSRQLVRARLTEQNLPGVSVAVGVAGDILWAEGFGWANLETRVPVAPGMRFRIGHVSKALTSAAVGLLLEKNRLRLDD